jgi:tetratricopeptide (TPR) repeat protein
MVALAYVDAWILPRHRILEPLRRVSEIAAEAGDFEYACLAEGIRGAMMPIIGCPLPEFEQTLGRLAWTQWSYAMSVAHSTASRVYSVLRTGVDLQQAIRDVMSAHEVTQDLYLYMSIHILYVRLIMGDHDHAFEEAERVREPMFRVQIGTHIADYVFLRGWAAAAVLRKSTGIHLRSARRALRDSLRTLRRWAHPGSDFVHMHQLLNAESMRLRGKSSPALAAYAKAAITAREHGHRHQAAMAHERRAELLRELRRDPEASASLRQAIELYEEWGAPVKVAALAAHHEADREWHRPGESWRKRKK